MIDRETAVAPGHVTDPSALVVSLPLERLSDPSWLLLEEGFNLVRERKIESIFAVANGYTGTRASLEEGSRLSQPVTFAAGVFADDPAANLGPALAVLPAVFGVAGVRLREDGIALDPHLLPGWTEM